MLANAGYNQGMSGTTNTNAKGSEMNSYKITFQDRTEQKQYVIQARTFGEALDACDYLPHSDWEVVLIVRVKDSETAHDRSMAIVNGWAALQRSAR
jgi:hypothetical protein